MAENIKEATDQNFTKEVLNNSKPVLVDFWAPWCGPCRALAPVIEEIAGEKPEYAFYKLNTDENQDTAVKFGIRSIPTMILFKDGQVIESISGSVPKNVIEDFLQKAS